MTKQFGTLYCRRDLVNVEEVRRWFEKQGIKEFAPDPHVTICYSKRRFFWPKPDRQKIVVPYSEQRVCHMLGSDDPPAKVMTLGPNKELLQDHIYFRAAGASHDFSEYIPHLTITYEAMNPIEVSGLVPFPFDIVLGPQVYDRIATKASR